MSILTRLSKRKEETPSVEVKACGHWELAPRWGCNEDIGKEDRVTYFTCSTCGESFAPEEARTLRSRS